MSPDIDLPCSLETSAADRPRIAITWLLAPLRCGTWGAAVLWMLWPLHLARRGAQSSAAALSLLSWLTQGAIFLNCWSLQLRHM